MVKFSLLRSMLDRWRVSYWVPEIVTVLRCQRFCDCAYARSLRCSPKPQHRATAQGGISMWISRQVSLAACNGIPCACDTRKAIEEGKACNINEDDIREANDVLMEELRKARNQAEGQASGTRRNSDKQTLTLKYFKFTDKFS